MAVQLILVRHGQPQVPSEGPTGNPPLSARGVEQAEHVARVLAHEKIDLIYSSGMLRADATAQPLADALSQHIHVHPDLGEIDRWGGEYANIEIIRQKGREEWARFLAAPLAYFGIDELRFRRETLAAYEAILEAADEKTVAVFTHGFPINILLSHTLGLNSDSRFIPAYCSITRLSGKSLDSLTVVSVNESGHIPEVLK